MSEANQNPDPIPMFNETLGGSLIDAARISVMGAMHILPVLDTQILLPGDKPVPNAHDCLDQAMEWLDAARAITVAQALQAGAPPTSVHLIKEARR